MVIKIHNSPLCANSKDKTKDPKVPPVPNINTYQDALSKSAKTGKTIEARKTAEKLVEIWERAGNVI